MPRSPNHARHVTEEYDPRSRFVLYRLCNCPTCEGKGKALAASEDLPSPRLIPCEDCRAEGRIRQEVASCESPEAVGVALVTLAREGEFEDCPFGLLERMPECEKCDGTGKSPLFPLPQHGFVECGACKGSGVKATGTWLVLPWLPSARNLRDAARTLARSKKSGQTQ